MRVTLIAFILLSVFYSAKGQEIEQFLEKIVSYNNVHPQEKIYLHTDKPSYAAGENLYFKSYSTIGIFNHFSSLSGVLYAELISPSNEIVQRVTISTPMGVGVGDFTLTDTITEGIYRIRAYTNWMKNAGSEYFFEKNIPIYNGRTDNVLTNTEVEEREMDVLYKINLKSVTGMPLSKKRVIYTILENGKIEEKKSVRSSELGEIEIPVNNKYNNPILNLRFENVDKNMVNKTIKTIKPGGAPVTRLFAEGGKAIYGRINTIAAKSINTKGLGVSSSVLLKQGSDTLGVIKTNELGMGAISVFLNNADPIEASVLYRDASKSKVDPLIVHHSGFSILVNNLNDNKLFAKLISSSDQLNNTEVYFVVHHLGEVFFVSKAKLNKEELVFSLEKSKLPTGVLTISILNDQFYPIIERPVFHYNRLSFLKSKVKVNKEKYTTREKVIVDLEVGEELDSVRFGTFSASVIDLGKVDTTFSKEAHIFSSLLLTNDISGYIESPNFYFDEKGLVKKRDLDYLMLTQGWRNIDWISFKGDSKPKYQPEKTLKISGYTKKIGRSKPEPKARVQLISTNDYFDYIDTVSNEEGYFEFDKLIFPDSVKFIITAKDGVKGKNYIDIVYEKDSVFPLSEKYNLSEDWRDINSKYLDNLKSSKEFFAELERMGIKEKAILIDEVVVTETKSKAPEYSSNLNGPGNADQIILAEDMFPGGTIGQSLAGRLLGVSFQGDIPVSRPGGVMQVILDGAYIRPESIQMINASDVESVEVLRNSNYTTIYGSRGGNGLIVITTKRGSPAPINYIPKGIITIQPQGFQIQKKFYKPEYDVIDALNYNTDLRSTIHWEPKIVSDRTGRASFDFFTSDSKGTYLLSLEGLDLGGRLLRKELIIIVE